MRDLALCCLLLSSSACGEPNVLRSDAPWGEARWAVVIELDAAGAPVRATPTILSPGQALRTSVSEPEGHRLWAVAYDVDISDCSFTHDSGPLPREPGARWESSPLAPDTPPTWAETTRDIVLSGTCPDSVRTCEGVELTRVEVGATFGELSAVHGYKTEALVGGTRRTRTSSDTELLQVNRSGRSETLDVPEAMGAVVGIVDVGFEIVGATTEGDLFLMRPELRWLERIPGGLRRAAGLETGTLLLQRSATITPAFVELTFPARTQRLRDDIPVNVRIGAPVGRDVEYMVTEDGEILRGDRRGTFVPEADLGNAPEALDIQASGDDVYVAARYAGVYHRDASGTWTNLGRPEALGSPLSIATLSRRRLLLGTRAGGLGLWDGRTWCTIPTDTRLAINDISVAVDGRTAWLVGGQTERNTTPLVLQVSVPP